MSRLRVIAFIVVGVLPICLVVFRVATKKRIAPGRASEQQMQQVQGMLDTYAKVITRPLAVEDFNQVIRLRAGTNMDDMSAKEREKLFTCVKRFYACYSSGDFEAFKQFRLHPPFAVGGALASAVKGVASQKGLRLESDEDVIHFAWDNYNGTNRIGQVAEQSIALAVVTRQDLGRILRQPSASAVRLPGLGAACWEGAVVYQPDPAELLQKEGSLRFFTLEMSVRFSPLKDGPATPLVLLGYWDSTREDWMPYCLCTAFHVGKYATMF